MRAPTAVAVAPPIPASISSKTSAAARVARARKHDDEREQHARELAARCDARERPRRLAGVRREEKLDALGTLRADALERFERDVEPSRRRARSRQTRRRCVSTALQRLARATRVSEAAASRSSRCAVAASASSARDATIASFVLFDAFGARVGRSQRSRRSSPPYLRLSRSIRSSRALIASSSAGSYSAPSSARASSAESSTASDCSADARSAISRSDASYFATPASAAGGNSERVRRAALLGGERLLAACSAVAMRSTLSRYPRRSRAARVRRARGAPLRSRCTAIASVLVSLARPPLVLRQRGERSRRCFCARRTRSRPRREARAPARRRIDRGVRDDRLRASRRCASCCPTISAIASRSRARMRPSPRGR